MKIFIGIPTIRRYEPFWQSMASFIPALRREVDVIECIVEGKDIATARNIIAEQFLASDADYLLFLDDDHEGHTIEMFDAILDPIINNNVYICALKCYKKGFPYDTNLLVFSGANEKALGIAAGKGEFMAVDLSNGYMYMDVVGFGMTLIQRMAFMTVGKPYFVAKNNCNEDNYFCKKLLYFGIQPVGCFDLTLGHGGIAIKEIPKLRHEGWIRLKEKYPDMKVLVS